MTRVTLTPRAQRDLDEIWDYTEANWGTAQAESYTRQLWQAIQTVAANPATGRACPEIRAGYRKYAAGSHVVFYRTSDAGIDIVRILHQRMDYGQHLN
jgi:toxin ParE1/3/4